MKYILNKDQQKALDAFIQFLLNPNQHEMVLTSGPGCGKSFLTGYIKQNAMELYKKACVEQGKLPEYFGIILSATTNKACTVLSAATREEVNTIHNIINLRVTPNLVTGEVKLKPTSNWRILEDIILIIDECSMINAELYDYIHKATNHCKILYVGDKNQLTPVKSGLSPVFTNNLPTVELKEVVRFAGSPELIKLADQLRETVETGIFKPIQIVPGIIDLYHEAEMENALDYHFKNTKVDARIVTYTNNRSVFYNNYIRKELRGLPDDFQYGERVINCNNAQAITHGNKINIVHVEDEIQILSIEPELEIDRGKHTFKVIPIRFINENLGIEQKGLIPGSRDEIKQLLKVTAKEKDWRTHYFLKESLLALRPRDSCTIHKVQGSTMDTVYIDATDLSTCTQKEVAARLLYVAVTRAKKHVVFYGDLAQKFGGFIV